MIAVFIVSFANTTLDSAARIQRLSLQEIFRNKEGIVRKPMNNRYVATFLVVLAAMVMTFLKSGATGALILWPLFGSLNQLLAALALGMVTLYLFNQKKNIMNTLLPLIFVLFVTIWAMFKNLTTFWAQQDEVLIFLSVLILGLTLLLLAGSLRAMLKPGTKVNLEA